MDQDIQQQYQEKRIGIARRTLAKGRDADIPFLSPILRHYQDISGRTYEGDKLSLKERGAGFVKASGEAAEMYSALGGGASGAAKGAVGKVESQGVMRTSGALQKGAQFLKDNPGIAKQGEKYAQEKINSKINSVKNYQSPNRIGVVGGAPRVEPLRTRGFNETVTLGEEEYLDDLSYIRNTTAKIKNEIVRNYNSDITAENKEIRDQVEHAEKMKQPSGFWFVIMAIYAGILDGLDILETIAVILTGVSGGSTAPVTVPAWLLATGIELALDIPLYLYAHASSKQMKAGKQVIELAESRITNVLRNIEILESRIRGVTKNLKRVRALNRLSKRSVIGKKARNLLAGTLKLTKKARGTGRVILSFIADLIPMLELVPWRTIAIIQQYRGRKAIYKGALEYEAQYEEAKSSEVSALNDLAEAQAEQVDGEAEETARQLANAGS